MDKETLHFWQSRLGLQDWDISIEECDISKLSQPDTLGECWKTIDYKKARILLLSKESYDQSSEDWSIPYCPERTLVHELLEIHMAFIEHLDGVESYENVMKEQAINAIAKALIFLKTGKEWA